MAPEEHSKRCGNRSSTSCGGDAAVVVVGGNGSGSNRSLKKLKQKKVQRRGPGVARLEKIRLEDQQKKDAGIFSPNALLSPTNSSRLSDVQCAPTSLRQNPSEFLIHLPSPPPPTDIFPPNPVLRHPSSISIVDSLHLNSVPLPNGGERGIGFPVIQGFDHGNWLVFWNNNNLERESHGLDHNGFEVGSNTNAPFESNSIWPPPSLLQNTQQFQHQPSSPMAVNVSLGNSSSSVMEPPSNQSFYSNYYIPAWSEEGKMVVTKSPYPYPMDNQSGPSFPCKFPPTYDQMHQSRRDVSGSSVTRGTDNAETSKPFLRKAPSSSTIMPEINPKRVTKDGENCDMNGDFLTLALPYQGNGEAPIHETVRSELTPPTWPFYNFFPSATQQNGQETAALSSWNEKVGENHDLNLKL